MTGGKPLWEPRSVPHRCLVSCNMERMFAGLAADADQAALATLERKTVASCLAELRVLDQERLARPAAA